MLLCIKHDPNASLKKSTFTELGIRVFQHATAVRCCARVFHARQQGILQDMLYIDYNAVPTF